MIRKHIPNALTCSNLLCGCIGVVEAFHGNLLLSCVLIALALIFDFFDGFAARLLGVSSPIGRDLDSLADMVTFGLLPSIIVFQLLMKSIPELRDIWMAYPAFTIAIFSALRLAKFNNDPRQSQGFIGLPTPANGILIASLPIILESASPEVSAFILNTRNLLLFTGLMSYLLVAEIPLIALKFKSFGWSTNQARYLLIGGSALLLILLQVQAIPIIILYYLLLSLWNNTIKKN
ncbi:CDP-diacylglycerol--serine O-phosphatidyltransferase [Dyadobacter jejuensis]|uniref:CDP-diacylglycerol--serine O-phosphatidyltransferase n=1 Tax=Dyadobacter jejuensis TaxID=1082580 RepID=A0A316AN71_9BACT|nr:CDP-diacylglycerol--serine O-phosphatidyltransferase [Dyadobacter jejuensis]PWJ58759.1 CDP-diacylglycerol--serine O-phosphatidyltransferase [Dyadobacter jejuensis]